MFFHFDERLQEPLKNGAGKRQCVTPPNTTTETAST